MDILSNEKSRAIAAIAKDQLGFFQDNEFWGPELFAILLEDPDSYKGVPPEFQSSVLHVTYLNQEEHVKLMVVREDENSPVSRARFFAEARCEIMDEEIAKANADLEALFKD